MITTTIEKVSNLYPFLSAFVPHDTKDLGVVVVVKDKLTQFIYDNLKRIGVEVYNMLEDNIDLFAYRDFNLLVDTQVKEDNYGVCDLVISSQECMADISINVINDSDELDIMDIIVGTHFTREIASLYLSYIRGEVA